MSVMKDKINKLKGQVSKAEEKKTRLEEENRELKMDLSKEASKRVSIENQGRKYMLEFSGIPEAENETSEDCKKTVRKLLRKKNC